MPMYKPCTKHRKLANPCLLLDKAAIQEKQPAQEAHPAPRTGWNMEPTERFACNRPHLTLPFAAGPKRGKSQLCPALQSKSAFQPAIVDKRLRATVGGAVRGTEISDLMLGSPPRAQTVKQVPAQPRSK